MSSEGENMQIVIRVRPMQLHEKKAGDIPCVSISNDEKEVQVKVGPLDAQSYRVSRCFGINTNQIDFFNQCGITSLLDSAIDGYRACAFAFGQTGAGKSYTMLGQTMQSKGSHNSNRDKHAGLITRSLEYIFHRAAQFEGRTTQVKICCLEIYHENVYDLFAEERERTSLNVREFSSNPNLNLTSNNLLNSTINPSSEVNFYVEGARMIECKSLEIALGAIEVAIKNRQVGGHELNSRSSRSHCLIEIYIESLSNDSEQPAATATGTLKTNKNFLTSHINSNGNIRGKMTLIDLAGSERLKNTNSKGKVLQEAGFINRSLYILGKVIAGLIRTNDYNHRDVPYRDSKLTKLLINSLGGRTRTLLISCLSEGKGSQNESLRTLKFSMSCARIKNRPLKLLDPQEKLIIDLKEEVKRLKTENKKLRNNILTSPNSSTLPHPRESPEGNSKSSFESLSAREEKHGEVWARLPPQHSSAAALKAKKKKLLQNQNQSKMLLQSKSEVQIKKSDKILAQNEKNNLRIRPQYKSVVYNSIADSSQEPPQSSNVDPDSATELILNINIDGSEFLKKKDKPKKAKKKPSASPYISHLSGKTGQTSLPQLVKPSVPPVKEKGLQKPIGKSVSLPQISSSLPPVSSSNNSEPNLTILKNKIATGSTKKKSVDMTPHINKPNNNDDDNKENASPVRAKLDTLSSPTLSSSPTRSPTHANPISNKIYELEKSMRQKRMEMEDHPGEVTADLEKKFQKLETEAKTIKRELLSLTSDVIPIEDDYDAEDFEDHEGSDEDDDEKILNKIYNDNNANDSNALWFLNDDDKDDKKEREKERVREQEKKKIEESNDFDDRDHELELLSQAIKNNTVSFSITENTALDPLKGSFDYSRSNTNSNIQISSGSNSTKNQSPVVKDEESKPQPEPEEEEEDDYGADTDFEATNDFAKSKTKLEAASPKLDRLVQSDEQEEDVITTSENTLQTPPVEENIDADQHSDVDEYEDDHDHNEDQDKDQSGSEIPRSSRYSKHVSDSDALNNKETPHKIKSPEKKHDDDDYEEENYEDEFED